MEKASIALKLARLTIAGLIELLRNVVDRMTDNPNFAAPKPLPDPPLAELTLAATELETAERDKKITGIANRNEKRQTARSLINSEALYVMQIAQGNGAIIESAGMPLRKTPSPRSEPGEVRATKIQDGTSQGEAVFTHKGATGTNNQYFVQYTYDVNMGEKSWVSAEPTSKLRVKFTGLTSGRRVAFRVRAKNTAGFGPWSAVLFRTIQ